MKFSFFFSFRLGSVKICPQFFMSLCPQCKACWSLVRANYHGVDPKSQYYFLTVPYAQIPSLFLECFHGQSQATDSHPANCPSL